MLKLLLNCLIQAIAVSVNVGLSTLPVTIGLEVILNEFSLKLNGSPCGLSNVAVTLSFFNASTMFLTSSRLSQVQKETKRQASTVSLLVRCHYIFISF